MTERTATTSRLRRRSPFAVLSAALASFLVVLALLTARVVTGTDPSLRATAQTQLVTRHGHTVIRTTASGKKIVETVSGNGGASTKAPTGLATRTSGTGERDG